MKLPRNFTRTYSHSFAARLTEAQLEQLFNAMSNGIKYADAATMARGWMKANAEAMPPGTPAGRMPAIPGGSAVGKWFKNQQAARRYLRKRDAARARAACTTETRHALEQARAAALLEGLKPTEIAAFERTELAREKLALEREKFASQALLKQAQSLLDRAKAGEKGPTLKRMIDLALEEIEKMQRGEA
ncbi:MAG: hypothetical protein JSS11_17095 [Verrucomicrobia bacterium]|nr:hypothetical protein [Verrucomicrobiota bacterium]